MRRRVARIAGGVAAAIVLSAASGAQAGEFGNFRRLSMTFEGVAQSYPTELGMAVAIDGSVAAVGAPSGDGTAATVDFGLTAIYRAGEVSLLQQPALIGSALGSRAGATLALALPVLAIGEPGASQVAVYRTDLEGLWLLEQVVPVPAVVAGFGRGLALDEVSLLIGATNPAGFGYVFPYHYEEGPGWVADAGLTGPVLGSRFGGALALSGDVLAIGAPVDGAGAVYLATRSGTEWTLLLPPLRPDGDPGAAGFGDAVALDGDELLAIGAPASDAGVGAVFVFRRDGLVWDLKATLRPPADPRNPTPSFGSAVVFAEGSLVIGAPTAGSGAVFVHNHPEDEGAPADLVIIEKAAMPGARVGHVLAAKGRRILVGAPASDVDPMLQPRGDVYAYDLLYAAAQACDDELACASGFCVDGVCCESACEDACMRCAVASGAAVDGVCGPLVCAEGEVCVDDACAAGTSSSSGGDASASASGGDPPKVGLDPFESGCGCTGAGGAREGEGGLLGLVTLGLGLGRRRRRAAGR